MLSTVAKNDLQIVRVSFFSRPYLPSLVFYNTIAINIINQIKNSVLKRFFQIIFQQKRAKFKPIPSFQINHSPTFINTSNLFSGSSL
jgi:hypothetical protein